MLISSGIKPLNRNNKKNYSANFSKSLAKSKPSYLKDLSKEPHRLCLPWQDKKLALNAEKLQRFLLNYCEMLWPLAKNISAFCVQGKAKIRLSARFCYELSTKDCCIFDFNLT